SRLAGMVVNRPVHVIGLYPPDEPGHYRSLQSRGGEGADYRRVTVGIPVLTACSASARLFVAHRLRHGLAELDEVAYFGAQIFRRSHMNMALRRDLVLHDLGG